MEYKEYCYVMDYSDASIYEIEINEENDGLETDDLLRKYNFNIDECYVLFTTNRITHINVL